MPPTLQLSSHVSLYSTVYVTECKIGVRLQVCCLVRCLTLQCCLRSSCLGLRAKIFVKKVSKQSRLSFKARQGVPPVTHVQNRTTLAEVASKWKRKETRQKCPCPSKCRSAPIWQKWPYRHTRGEHGRSCLNPRMCRSARSGRSALELQKKFDVAKVATEQAVQKCTTNTRDCETNTREGKLSLF